MRSLRRKIDHIKFVLFENPFDIFAISESWLDSSISDAEMSIDGYNLERKDRNLNQGRKSEADNGGDIMFFF